MAKKKIVNFESGGEYIPWSDSSSPAAPPPVNHSGQPTASQQVDPELLELAAMEAEERARPLGHGKAYVGGTMAPAGPVERGEPVPSNGVGQETLDGLIEANALEEEKKAAALQGYLTQLAMHNAGRLMGATNRALGNPFGI